MKKEKKDQFIIAHITDLQHPETVLSYASYMSQMLQKGLILLYICDPKYTKLTTDQAEQHLKALNSQFSILNSTYAVLKGNTHDIISALPTLLSAVLVVTQVDKKARRSSPMNPRTILKNYADCKTAFLVVQQESTFKQSSLPDRKGGMPAELVEAMALSTAEIESNPAKNQTIKQFRNVATAIDFRKESKDKIIWSSYFPRFGKSNMHILYYEYKDEFLHNKWYATMQQLHKLYNELGITFQPHIIPSKSTFLDINALQYAHEQGYDLLISVTTKEKDGLEFFIGTQERRTIVNRFRIPILFLNPREGLYVLCD